MTKRTIAIVGAGIVGCLIARELAADPGTEIVVLDRDLVGSGASRRSAGLSLVAGATPRVRAMASFSHRYYADLRASYPDLPSYPVAAKLVTQSECDPVTAGYLPGETSPAEVINLRPGKGTARGTLAGHIRLPQGTRAWQIGGCHYTDVYTLTQRLAALARPRLRVIEGACVTSIKAGSAGVTLCCGSGESVTADQVVLAPGPWLAAAAWRDLTRPLGLAVKKIVAMHIERPPASADEAIIFHPQDAFLLPMRHRGHWLFSYTCTEWNVDPDVLAAGPGLSAADIEAARECLRRYSPALARACTAGRVFADTYSPAREPVVRSLDAAGRIVFAGAANGSGYRLGPAIAAEAAGLLRRTWNESESEGAADDHQHV